MVPILFSWHAANPCAGGDVFEKRMRLGHLRSGAKVRTTYDGGYLLGSSFVQETDSEWLLRRYDAANTPINTYRVMGDGDIYFDDMIFSQEGSVGMLGSLVRNHTVTPLLASMTFNESDSLVGHLLRVPFPVAIEHLLPISSDRYLLVGSLLNTSSGKDLFIAEVHRNRTVLKSFMCDVGWGEEVTDWVVTNRSFLLAGRFLPYAQGLADIFVLEVSRTYDHAWLSLFGTEGVDDIFSLTRKGDDSVQLMGTTNVTGDWDILMVNMDKERPPALLLIDVLGDATGVDHIVTGEGYAFFGQDEVGFLIGTFETTNDTLWIDRWDQNGTIDAYSFFGHEGGWTAVGRVGYNQTHGDLIVLGMDKEASSQARCSVPIVSSSMNFTGNVAYEAFNITLAALNMTIETVNLSVKSLDLEELTSCYYLHTPAPTKAPLIFHGNGIRPRSKRSYNTLGRADSSAPIRKAVMFLAISAGVVFAWVLLINAVERYGYPWDHIRCPWSFVQKDRGMQLTVVMGDDGEIRYVA